MNIAANIRRLSAELSSDIMIVCGEEDETKRNVIVKQIEAFLSTIRKNESIRTFTHRQDDPGQMTMLIALGDHESKDAIVKALWKRAEKEANKASIRIWTKELKSSEAMHSAVELEKVARIVDVHEC